MPDYQKMYYLMFHAAEDTISILGTPPYSAEEIAVRTKAVDTLIAAQQACEDIYVESEG